MSELLITHKGFINFQYFFFKHKISLIIHNFSYVSFHQGFPYPFIKIELDPLPWKFIKTLKVAFVHIYSFSISAPIAKIFLDFIGNMLTLGNFAGFFLSIPQIIINISSQDVLIREKKGIFGPKLLIFEHLDCILRE